MYKYMNTYKSVRVPWNKGKTGVYSRSTIEKMRIAKIGISPVNKGKHHSDEARRKMSNSKRGRPCLNGFKKRSVPWNKEKTPGTFSGKNHSAKTKILMSANQIGENNSNWKGGSTDHVKLIRLNSKYKEWRKSVFERDNYTCQSCGTRGGTLNADHIKPLARFPNLAYKINNGRTLCVECHKKTDTFGYKSSLRIYKAYARTRS